MRYEVSRWSKEQGCHFQTFGETEGIMVYETEKTDKEKHRLWNFACVDSSLYETRDEDGEHGVVGAEELLQANVVATLQGFLGQHLGV